MPTATPTMTRRRLRGRVTALAAGAALAAAGALALPGAAHAAFPGGNGKLYYIQGHNVFSVNPDGSGNAQLTSDGTDTIAVVNPAGTKVAFLDSAGDSDQVYTMNPDGSGVTQVTTAASALTGVLAWSPDGAKLVYEPGALTLTVINADGSSPVALNADGGGGVAWSPDGTKIAYSDFSALNTIHPDGTGQATVASAPDGSFALFPSWAPDGSELTFTELTFMGPGQIDTVHADGTALTTIRADSNDNELPVWSPDGTKIAFSASGNLDVMNTDGSGETQVPGPVSGFPSDWAAARIPPAADLSVALTATPHPALLGATITLTVSVTNHGPGALTSGTVTATLPAPMTAASSTCATAPGTVTCTLPALASGAASIQSFTVPIALLTLGIPYTVTATRTASTPADPNPANDTASRTCTIITSLIINCH